MLLVNSSFFQSEKLPVLLPAFFKYLFLITNKSLCWASLCLRRSPSSFARTNSSWFNSSCFLFVPGNKQSYQRNKRYLSHYFICVYSILKLLNTLNKTTLCFPEAPIWLKSAGSINLVLNLLSFNIIYELHHTWLG
jgi:hypothetical protein